MNYKNFKQIIEQIEVVDANKYNLLVQKYGKETIDKLFERYLNDNNIEDDDKKFNRTSYYIEQATQIPLGSDSYSEEKDVDLSRRNNYTSESDLDLYFQEIDIFPLLDPTKEKELMLKIDKLRDKKDKLKITPESLDKELTTIGYKGPFNRECYSRRKQIRYIEEKLSQLQLQREQLKDKEDTFESSSSKQEINNLTKQLDEEIIYLQNLQEKLNIQHDYQESFELVVNSNLRLVVFVAKKYIRSNIPIQDLIQEGNQGLMKAIEKFDATKNNKLSTYATWWIWQSITRAIRNQSRLIRIPVSREEQINKIRNIEKKLTIELERKPTYKEIATELNDDKLDEHKIENILTYDNATNTVSFASPILEREDLTLEELVVDETANVEEDGIRSSLRNELEEVLKTLTPKEQEVIRLRYGLDDNITRTLEEIGQGFGNTREAIRQIEAKAFTKLRKPNISKRIKDFL